MSQSKLPKKPKIQTSWNLTLLYKSQNDPKIEEDVCAYERAHEAFARKHKRVDTLLRKPRALAKALKEYERLLEGEDGNGPMLYFTLRRELNAHDSLAEKKLTQIADRLTKASNKILFFEVALSHASKQEQKLLLAHKEIAPYRFFLERVFLEGAHTLSEPEEKILSLKGMPAHGLWVSGFEKIMNKRNVRFKGKEMPFSLALGKLSHLGKTDRRKLWGHILDECESLSEIAENELNAIIYNKKINDELCGYPKPYSATIMGWHNNERSIEALIEAVSNKGFAISARYYKLKARLLKMQQLEYVDRVAPFGKKITINFDTAVDMLREVYYHIHDEYGAILDRMLANGQIDVYPKSGKGSGAFQTGGIGLPSFVFLNQVDDMRSFSTFAHEMGHAIHTERSKVQRPLYQSYTISAAETASTLFENLVFEELLKKLSPKEQIVALHDKLDEEVASIMRQIAFFNFELELHNTIRKEGALTNTEMAQLFTKHLKSYLGPKVKVTEKDGYSFIYINHIRSFFYVYTYAYGILISNILARRWKEDPSYIASIDAFLTAGGSDTPDNIFKSIGVDTTTPSFFETGLDAIAANISKLDKLTRGSK